MTQAVQRTMVAASANDDMVTKDWLESLMGFRLRQAYNIFASDFQAEMQFLGLRPVQISILAVLDENPGIRQGQIGEALNIARENTAPLVNELQKAGYLERHRHPTDGRAFAVCLTPAGKKVLAQGKAVIEAHERHVLASMTADDQRQLTALLTKLIDRR